MPKYPIDLSYSMDDMARPMSMREKMFPMLHLEWPDDYDLPESGEMTVTFKKTSEQKSKRDGKMKYTVDLEIRSIDSVEEGEDMPDDDTKEESGADALDRYAKEASDKDNSE